VRQLEVLLAQAVDEPEQPIMKLSLVTPVSRAVLPDPTKSIERVWHGSVAARIQTHARHRPHQVAVTDQRVSLSYRDLDLLSERLMNSLNSNGVGKGDVVAVLGQRSASLVVALVGVMKAGAAFMILDPRFPDARLMANLRIGKPRGLLLTEAGVISEPLADSLRPILPMWSLQLDLNSADDLNQLHGRGSSRAFVQNDPDAIAYVAFTSGSTGDPKAVIGTHAPLSHFLDWHCRTFMLNEIDRFCMLSGLSHDPLLRDIFTPLWQGATLYVPDSDDIGTRRLAEWIRKKAITVAHLTPALAGTLTAGEQGELLQELRYAFFGGDLLTGQDTINLRRLAPNATLVNFYGTTETPQAMAYFVVDRAREPVPATPVPLGRGIEDVQLLVLNESGELAGVGEVGEITVRTPHLTVGYLNDTELTRARYVINRFTGRDDDRVYRTGDLGRYLPDGNVEFAGRTDRQVKVRGYRIELQEVQTALQTHACVRDCAVVDREYGAGDRRLVAYIVPTEQPPTVHDLRQHLSGRLPEYMLPAFFVTLDQLPLTPNGKLDRAALPAPGQPGGDERRYLAPRTTTEELVAGIWSHVLEVERIGVGDNFFELGGHSLLAMQVNSRVCEALHVDVPLRDLFTHSTLEEFAQRLDELMSGSPLQETPITRIPRDQELPFSFNESSLLFSHWVATAILKEGKFPFYIVLGLQLKGHLNVQALEDALNEIIRRHEVLRTAFSIIGDGSPETVSRVLQLGPREIGTSLFKRSVHSDAPLSLVINDIDILTSLDANTVVRRALGKPFDYEHPPMLRALLFKTNDREHHLTLLLHHIASDGWSVRVLRKEMSSLYDAFSKGLPSSIDELAIQYVDFADWQHRKFQGEFLARGFAYWKKQLTEFSLFDTRDLPFFRPDGSTNAGGFESVIIDSDVLQRFRSFARAKNITLSMFLLAGLNILLHLYTGKERIGIWSLFANRTRPGTEGMIGSFSHRHLVAMEVLADQIAESVLDGARDLVIDATAHSEIPFILVQMLMNSQGWRSSFVEDMNETRATHESDIGVEQDVMPESHVSFDLEAGNLDVDPSDGLVIEPVYLPRPNASLDLRILGTDRETHLVLGATYSRRLFSASNINEMLADFTRVLERLVSVPDAPISSFANIIRAPYLTQDEMEGAIHSQR
jgi:amino acid adenylation domain-containing protein